ncbi:MAG: radical SAM protein [Methanoregulaceae archaeon]|jgi:hypothetical protein
MKKSIFNILVERIFPYYECRPSPMLFGVTRPFETSPSFRYKALGGVEFIRIQRGITSLLGQQYQRSRKLIEIDLTYACNLKCHNCNRSCSQAPSREFIEVNKIQNFVDDSIREGVYWKRIRLLGGEPTLHPYFFDIIDILLKYKEQYSPHTKIQIATNGYGSHVTSILSKLPECIEIINSEKTDSSQFFSSFNVAPKDLFLYKFADFTNGCWIAEICGMGLTPRGYYPCAIAGGIDRVFEFNMGSEQLPKETDDMLTSFNIFCQYCGHFKRLIDPPINEPIISKTWENAYANYETRKKTAQTVKGSGKNTTSD